MRPVVVRRRVAVVGAGPAGLSAAHDLALLGYDVTVFEAAEEPFEAGGRDAAAPSITSGRSAARIIAAARSSA